MTKFLCAAAVAALGFAAWPAAAQQAGTGTPCPAGQERMPSGDCQATGSDAPENMLGNNPQGATDATTTGSGGGAAGTPATGEVNPEPGGVATGGASGSGTSSGN